MARPNTSELLNKILSEVIKFQKLDRKSLEYGKAAQKVKASIFTALDRIPKKDFELYKEKIERIIKRLNNV